MTLAMASGAADRPAGRPSDGDAGQVPRRGTCKGVIAGSGRSGAGVSAPVERFWGRCSRRLQSCSAVVLSGRTRPIWPHRVFSAGARAGGCSDGACGQGCGGLGAALRLVGGALRAGLNEGISIRGGMFVPRNGLVR